MTPVEQITSLYIGYFGRAPDPEGLNYWVGRLADGFSLAEIAESFSVQPESTSKYPYLANTNIASPQAFITQVYMNLFNRMPDAAGLAYWTAELGNGTDVGDFILNVISGAVTAPDSTIIENKIEVGAYAAEQAANTPNFVYDADAQAAAVAVIDGVDATDASVVEAKAEVDAFLGGDLIENTVVLTTAIDNAIGTTGNDQFNGVIAAGANGTFNTGDTISGSGGQDVLSLIITNGDTVTPAGLTSVETIRVQDLSGGSIDLTNAVGLTTIVSNNSTNDTNFDNVQNLVDAVVSNTSSGIDLTIEYVASVVSGTADVQNVTFDNVSEDSTDVDVNGIEIFNVTVIGDNVAGLISDVNVTTINTLGSGSIVYDNNIGSTVTTFNASANSGGVEAIFDAGGDVKATGGSGDDRFDFGVGLTTADTVIGGAGFDSVVVDTSGTADYSAAADAAAFNALAGVERAWFTGNAGVTLNGATFTNTGITNIEFQTDGDDLINNAGSARTYEFGNGNTGDATFEMNAASTALNLKFFAGSAVDALEVNLNAQQPITAVSTVNIEAEGPGFVGINSIDLKAGSTINVTGDADIDLGFVNTKVILNASALTGDLTFLGSDIDAALGASAGDVITLGSGQDTILFDGDDSGVTVNVGTVATPDLRLVVDVINNFTAGADGDVLDFGAPGVLDSDYTAVLATAQTAISALSGADATLQNAANLAVEGLVQTGDAGEWTAFTFQGQTYAVYDAAAGATYDELTDTLVQITGVTVANLTDANFA